MNNEASETIASRTSVWRRIWTRIKIAYSPLPIPIVPRPSIAPSPEVQRVQASFEGREAIYIEKGVVRVRVSNIRATMPQVIEADVEEIPTPGLGVGRFDKSNRERL